MRLICLLAIWSTACRFDLPEQEPVPDAGDDAGTGCFDADGDTICDADDKCAGHDDRVDVDGDEIVDGCDDWPCGVKPNAPGEQMSDSGSEGRSWAATFINIGDNRRAVVTAGQPFNARFQWGLLIDCGAGQSSCRAQVEVGYGTTRSSCIFDDNVPEKTFISLNFNGQLTAPATPGVHELRLNAGRATACGTGTSWYGGDPGPDSTIAILCVR